MVFDMAKDQRQPWTRAQTETAVNLMPELDRVGVS
jgi:hypothetical protein